MTRITDERLEELGTACLERIPHSVNSVDRQWRDIYSCLEELLRRRQAERQFIADLSALPPCEE